MEENEDCYFYYYSTCNKGTACPYRHEPAARGTEQICEDWEYGSCRRSRCRQRHMRIQVNRNSIRCYWESQLSGCQKPHCVFKHTKPRNIPSAERKLGLAEGAATLTGYSRGPPTGGVPSAEIGQVLIHPSQTDEESPQKTRRIKPAVAEPGQSKKISLRHLQRDESGTDTADAEPENPDHLGESCKRLEDEILECARKGTTKALNSPTSRREAVTEKRLVNPSPVKVKTLKDIKREKVLRARLEFERRKLLATQRSGPEAATLGDHKALRNGAGESLISGTKSTPAGFGAAAGTQPSVPTLEPVHGEEASITKHTLPDKYAVSKKVEVSSKVSLNIEEVKVKSFNEIMEEKRKRKLVESQPESKIVERPSQHKEPGSIINQRKAIIAPRKMKIRSTRIGANPGKATVKLKRPVPRTKPGATDEPALKASRDEFVDTVKSRVKDLIPPNQASSSDSERGRGGGDATPHYITEDKRNPSTDSRDDGDIESENILLDESAYLKGEVTDDIIDDDDLMNEMDQLLA